MPVDSDDLGRSRHIVVILRLVLDDAGALSHGEVLDDAGRLRGRFGRWGGLVPVLRQWLEDGDSVPRREPDRTERGDEEDL